MCCWKSNIDYCLEITKEFTYLGFLCQGYEAKIKPGESFTIVGDLIARFNAVIAIRFIWFLIRAEFVIIS